MQLEKYEEKQVAKISKLQKKAEAFKVSASKLTVKSDSDIKKARALIKEVNAYKTDVGTLRKQLTTPLNDIISQFIAKEKEVFAPLDEAKKVLGDKVIAYEEELEKVRLAEQARIDDMLDRFSEIVYSDPAKTVEDVDAKGKQIKEYYSSLDKKDQGLAAVKLALTTSVERLTSLKDGFLQREASAKEQAERDKSIAMAEVEARKEEVRDSRATAARPKTGMVEITKFEITDANLVPRRLCSPDDSKIRQAIKDGTKDIPGVRVYTEKKVR